MVPEDCKANGLAAECSPPPDPAAGARDIVSLVKRAQRGDREAAEEIVRRFEPQVRLEARVRLERFGMRSFLDSSDISQSVFRALLTGQQIPVNDPQDARIVAQLLHVMVQQKIVDKWRRHTARKRDMRRTQHALSALQELPSRENEPVELAAAGEIQEAFLQRLAPEVRTIAERRLAGVSWREIALEQAETPHAIRLRFFRAIRSTCRMLGWPMKHG